MSNFDKQLTKIKNDKGFIAALDQSGGSTPKALKLYGLGEDAYKNEQEMFDVVHKMRTRMITSPAFSGKRLIGAILFENTMDRDIDGKPTPTYLWDVKGVVPFLKVDKGLADEKDGVQLMKPIPGLDALLKRAKAKDVFGTKMRSVIKQANKAGIDAVVKQQFELGKQIIAAGLVPIIEPEVDIKTPEQGAGRGAAEGRDHEGARRAEARPEGHAEAHDSGQGRSLRGSDQAQERAARGRALGRLLARRREQDGSHASTE